MKKAVIATTTAALALAGCSSPAWNETDKYNELCAGDPIIAPELQPVVDAMTLEEGWHVQGASWRTSSSELGMHEVGFNVCAPISGDDLKEVAERLAIETNSQGLGETITTMFVSAWPADSEPETRLRDTDYQSHIHDGGEAFENGAYRGSWTDVTAG